MQRGKQQQHQQQMKENVAVEDKMPGKEIRALSE